MVCPDLALWRFNCSGLKNDLIFWYHNDLGAFIKSVDGDKGDAQHKIQQYCRQLNQSEPIV